MSRVEFVEYTGDWPNLCRGDLTVKIEGKEVTFSSYAKKGENFLGMCSGGSCGFNEDYSESYINEGEWTISIPEEYKEYKKEIEDLVNSNVRWGCCGGCL